jgi:hypothetical protein
MRGLHTDETCKKGARSARSAQRGGGVAEPGAVLGDGTAGHRVARRAQQIGQFLVGQPPVAGREKPAQLLVGTAGSAEESGQRHHRAVGQSQDGPRYHVMVSTSRFVFTPAAGLALVGFLALLADTGDVRMIIGGSAGLLLAGAFALTRRPDLGAD